MSSSNASCRANPWRPKKRYLALLFLIAAAAYQAHVQWSSIRHALIAAHDFIDAAVRNKIITTDGRVRDKVRMEFAPLLKRIEKLERSNRQPPACPCRQDFQPRRSDREPFQFPSTGN